MASQQAKRLGARAKERRDELGLTQRQVAEAMTDRPNVDSQVISKWERGSHRPNDANLEAFAVALQTTVADLMAGPLAEREPKPTETPDLNAALGGGGAKRDDDLRELVEASLANQDEILRRLTALEGVARDLAAAVQTLAMNSVQAPPSTRRAANG